ncbi:MAG: hypothetical protein ISR96_13365 [Nitrospira sp.]|nr:hypothetical protein [bacterium]MBL7050497.1 hypothetical protein [Nitrospira sp.]
MFENQITTIHKLLQRFDPAVDKNFLLFLSGLTWTFVGVLLCNLAATWLVLAEGDNARWLAVGGIVFALCVHHFGFLKLVDKNIDRIIDKKGKVCVFGFQPWKSYLIILVMITMGSALRHSSLPKQYLAIIYIGFGGAMFLSSLRYYRILLRQIKKH